MRPYIETGGMRRDHPFCQLNCRLSYGSIAEAASFCYNEREVKPMAELDKRKFGAFVAALRKENGMTQKALAEKLFVSDKAVSKWETGVSIPDTAMLLPLSEALGVTVTELLCCERMEKPRTLTPEEVDDVVRSAICYPGGKRRAYQEKSWWPLLYLISAAVSGLGLYSVFALALPSSTVKTFAILSLLFGAYFCFFVRLKLPGYYDHDRIGAVYDGVFRMNIPGLSLNNRNWPKIVLVGRCWICAMAALWPWIVLGLGTFAPDFWAAAERPAALLLTLGGLVVPMYLVGKRYE